MYGRDHALEEEIPYHQKMARMSNARESQDLKKTSKKLDKMKTDKFEEISREEKDLRQKFVRLMKEREESRREVEDVANFLQQMQAAKSTGTAPAFSQAAKSNKGVENIMMRSHVTGSSEAESLDPNIALRLLETLVSSDDNRQKTRQRPNMQPLYGLARPSQPNSLSVEKPAGKTTFAPSAASALQLGINSFAKELLVEQQDLQSSSSNLMADEPTSSETTSTLYEDGADQESTTTQDTITESCESSDTLMDMGWLSSRKITKTTSELPSTSVGRFAPLKKTVTVIDHRASQQQAQPDGEDIADRNNLDVLEKYYDLFMESQEQTSDAGINAQLKVNSSLSTFKRSQRRKVMALENLLKQLPSFKQKQERTISHKDALECRYLRLPQGTIREQERLCREVDGVEPGIHAHMTEEDVIDYLQGNPLAGSKEAVAADEAKEARPKSKQATPAEKSTLVPKRSSWKY